MPAQIESEASASSLAFERSLTAPFDNKTTAGNYLTSLFAQQHHDWHTSVTLIEDVIKTDPENLQLLSRAMVLSAGAGQFEQAVHYARRVRTIEPDNSLAGLLLTAESFQQQDYKKADDTLAPLEQGGLSEFMMPLLQSWAKAGNGEYDIDGLQGNTIHLHHAILIAEFLDKKSDIDALLQRALSAQGMTLDDLSQIADMYAHIGKADMAEELYRQILAEWPENAELQKKIKALNTGQTENLFTPIATPEQGVARGFYDMAILLYREYSDDSARVFANMATYLDPALHEATLMMAHLYARNDRIDEAIAHYNKIPPGHETFLQSQRLSADALEEAGRDADAMSALNRLYERYQDIDALIQIGDIQRRNEDFAAAIESYNKAERTLGTIGADHWHLFYVRGMSYEQNSQWLKAEQDLKAALEFQPNHPLVLNYLGYAWADQGINLDKSLDFIRRAAAQDDRDGYIIDTLGWVL
jgi:tetratricopeptide (TPR) repeat protein